MKLLINYLIALVTTLIIYIVFELFDVQLTNWGLLILVLFLSNNIKNE